MEGVGRRAEGLASGALSREPEMLWRIAHCVLLFVIGPSICFSAHSRLNNNGSIEASRGRLRVHDGEQGAYFPYWVKDQCSHGG